MNEPMSRIRVRFAGRVGRFPIDVAFDVPMKGITALTGPSGGGKTTILRAVAGLETMDGELIVGDEVWQDTRGRFVETYRRPIGYVFQESSLFSHLSVSENLRYGQKRARRRGSTDRVSFDEVVDLMGIRPLLGRSTTALSGGERQRVAIGRALLAQPRLLLMDEPLAALDRRNREEILPYLERLHEERAVPILYVTHHMPEIERLADVLVLIDSGRVTASGPLGEMLANTDLPLARASDAASVLDASVRGFDTRYGLTEMDMGGAVLFVPGQAGEIGAMRRIRIAAADVSLATRRPSQTSILNVLAARIVRIEPIDTARVNVVVRIGSVSPTGVDLLARISRRAYDLLDLEPGQDVYAQVKAVSLVASGQSSAV